MNDRRIALEICLTSNVQTRAVASYAAHPLRSYFDHGQIVVLNTDNRLMSGVTLTDEYAHAATSLGFTLPELAQIARNGFESAFAPWHERRTHARRVRSRAPRAPRAAVSDAADMVARAADMVREKIGDEISTALILGSGLGGLADRIENPISIPYRAIPGFPPSSVPGHAGALRSRARSARERVIVAAGRYHLYEGHSTETVALPTRVLHACGVRTLFVSNAAGGINRSLRPGDLMIIEDHLNLMSRTPLAGPSREGETRFPDMSAPYDRALIRELRDAALECGIPVASGVYAALLGPAYETPAEIRMLDEARRGRGRDVHGSRSARRRARSG